MSEGRWKVRNWSKELQTKIEVSKCMRELFNSMMIVFWKFDFCESRWKGELRAVLPSILVASQAGEGVREGGDSEEDTSQGEVC